VTEDFIEDDFNLTGLNTMVPFWKEAMEMVLDVEPGVGLCGSIVPVDNISHIHAQTKTLQKFLMFLS